MWKSYYSEEGVDENEKEEILMKVVEELKKNVRSEIYTVRAPSLIRMFDFLDFLASNKNKLAPIIYKKIIFLFV